MYEEYAFYRELEYILGEAQAKEFMLDHFVLYNAQKVVSKAILETSEPDIREYIGSSLFGPFIKAFIKDDITTDDRVSVVYTVIIPKEHVKDDKR